MKRIVATVSLGVLATALLAGAAASGVPGYEKAYVNNTTVTINAIEAPQKNPVPGQAQADFYEVVYPIGWQSMGLAPPQCNPCDHDGNGIDFLDYHDHILDSVPSTGHGEFNPHWHVWVIAPAYSPNGSNPDHDAAVGSAYGHMIPTTSETAVNALLAAHMPDGSPVAVKIDTHFYFICAVVGQGAGK